MVLGTVVGLMTASTAVAEPRDSVDRGQRLDTDALRDDAATNRLEVPHHPLVIVPPQQLVPPAKGKKKSSASKR
ncbi:hypothetical protein NLM33_10765 [Bradyrhizobium sp. CCGUVB1N3]|uniref:hypothetical protein n=1 Tax=Bradyrhizobium sp. CCGUVB1N3 TaxID=2949629 RepID=UPI0020B21355|nr:hypothetical protein [Bradyrhizobium sp. CCGUVB1N3]MCP3470802.1 hypothetical protein [Bradyrhizobium sp. CCGUVB1N3]